MLNVHINFSKAVKMSGPSIIIHLFKCALGKNTQTLHKQIFTEMAVDLSAAIDLLEKDRSKFIREVRGNLQVILSSHN